MTSFARTGSALVTAARGALIIESGANSAQGQRRSDRPLENPCRTRTTVQYRSDIDGLRCVAVASVVLYHAGVGGFAGGYVGVDVFFVISGFLITSIIVHEIRVQRFSLPRFYERRMRRLFPALFAVLAFSSIAAWLLFLPNDFRDFGRSVAATAVFASNFLFWSEAGYCDTPATLKPLLHTWTLAVEEQLYLLFPLAMLLTA
jgi:peptidoglycan/LPS O-acetylase OafA/YrhL